MNIKQQIQQVLFFVTSSVLTVLASSSIAGAGPLDYPDFIPLDSGARVAEIAKHSYVSDIGCAEGVNKVRMRPPGSNLNNKVAKSPVGTCFLFAEGVYDFQLVTPKDNMSFIGTSAREVIIDGTGHENAFSGTASNVTIANMTFKNFNQQNYDEPNPDGNGCNDARQDIVGGTRIWTASPIRGSKTSEVWSKTYATGWRIDGVRSVNNWAAGILLGNNFVVTHSEFSNNGVTGITGRGINGGRIENNLIEENGFYQAGGNCVNGSGVKLIEANATSSTAEFVVSGNTVRNNYAATLGTGLGRSYGIWCDAECSNVTIRDNNISGQDDGVYLEVSPGPFLVEHNTISGRRDHPTAFFNSWSHGCIDLGESAKAVVRKNETYNCYAALMMRQADRPEGYKLKRIKIEDNYFSNSQVIGVSAFDPAKSPGYPTITFSGNYYNDIKEYWWQGQRHSQVPWTE